MTPGNAVDCGKDSEQEEEEHLECPWNMRTASFDDMVIFTCKPKPEPET